MVSFCCTSGKSHLSPFLTKEKGKEIISHNPGAVAVTCPTSQLFCLQNDPQNVTDEHQSVPKFPQGEPGHVLYETTHQAGNEFHCPIIASPVYPYPYYLHQRRNACSTSGIDRMYQPIPDKPALAPRPSKIFHPSLVVMLSEPEYLRSPQHHPCPANVMFRRFRCFGRGTNKSRVFVR